MRKIVIILIFSLNVLQAQEKGRFDYNVGSGILSTNHITDILVDVVTLNADDSRTTLRTPAFNATFKYAVENNWFISADGVYELVKQDFLDKKDIVIGQGKCSYYTIAIGTEYHYLNKKIVQLYSGGAIGATFETSNIEGKVEKDYNFNFQLNLIGIRIGKKIAGTLELGIGYKGILNIGLSYQP